MDRVIGRKMVGHVTNHRPRRGFRRAWVERGSVSMAHSSYDGMVSEEGQSSWMEYVMANKP